MTKDKDFMSVSSKNNKNGINDFGVILNILLLSGMMK